MEKLPLSERVHNWVQSIAAAWPILIPLLGGAVYGNSDTVKRWVHGPDTVVPVEMTENNHNAAINAKFQELEAMIEDLKLASSRGDGNINTRLQSQIDANAQAISKWHSEN